MIVIPVVPWKWKRKRIRRTEYVSELIYSNWTFNTFVTFKEHREYKVTFISTDGDMIHSGENKYYPEVTYGFSCLIKLDKKESNDKNREDIALQKLLNDCGYKKCIKEILDKFPEREYEVENKLDFCGYEPVYRRYEYEVDYYE